MATNVAHHHSIVQRCAVAVTMVEQGQLVLSGIQFSLNTSGAGPQLQLGSHAQQRRGKAALGASRSGVAAAAAACSFSTGGCSKALVGRSAQRRARASPFASISMALPFAAATMSKPAAPGAAPADGTKKKKSIGEILENAGKKALSGGIPGMVAMALQVLSLMWLR